MKKTAATRRKVDNKRKRYEACNYFLISLIIVAGIFALYYVAGSMLWMGSKLIFVRLMEGYWECRAFASKVSFTEQLQELSALRADMYVNGSQVQQLFYCLPTVLKILAYIFSMFVVIHPIRMFANSLKRRSVKSKRRVA